MASRVGQILTFLSAFAVLSLLLTTIIHSPRVIQETTEGAKLNNLKTRRDKTGGSQLNNLRTRRDAEIKVNDADNYSRSELATFVEKNRGRVEEARKQREFECGSIVNVTPIDCDVCMLFVDGLLTLIERGSTQDDMTEFATRVCIDLRIENERVCKAMVQQYKDMLFNVIIRVGYKPDEVCAMALGSECGIPWSPTMMWNVSFPDTTKPPVEPPKPPKAGSPTLRVLHITDFHFDTEYQQDNNAECGAPLCCRHEDGPPAPGFKGAGKYGDYRHCDTPQTTLDSLFKHLNATQGQFDYVLFTGDVPPHNVWNQSRRQQLDALQDYVFYMKTYLPNKPVFNALGNHESAPCNSFPPPYITGNDSETWLYDALVTTWRNWLPPDTEATIRWGGYYSHSPFPGFRIISLNMNFGYSLNWWLFINATDPAGMMQWFISELQSAEDKGEKVHVIGHGNPGGGDCLKAFSWNYYKIVNRYENTIVAQFFGHNHRNLYELFYDEATLTRPLGVAYIPGSITPYSYLNPGYRIYEIDGNYPGSSWRVQDYTNYFLNITEANTSWKPVWRKEYNAKKEYGLQHLFPDDWNDLIYRMKYDDKLYASFCKHNVKSAPNICDSCHGPYCKLKLLCQLKTGRSGDSNLCNDLYNLKGEHI